MPQFDFYSFSGQVFWSLSGFFCFYFFILRFYVISFSEVLKMRQKLVDVSMSNDSNASITSTSNYDKLIISSI
jgi:hypothetical protein